MISPYFKHGVERMGMGGERLDGIRLGDGLKQRRLGLGEMGRVRVRVKERSCSPPSGRVLIITTTSQPLITGLTLILDQIRTDTVSWLTSDNISTP